MTYNSFFLKITLIEQAEIEVSYFPVHISPLHCRGFKHLKQASIKTKYHLRPINLISCVATKYTLVSDASSSSCHDSSSQNYIVKYTTKLVSGKKADFGERAASSAGPLKGWQRSEGHSTC